MGARGTMEFISEVRGHKTRWPFFIAAGLFVVCLLAYSTSHFLVGAGGSPATTEGRMEIEAGPGDVSAEENASSETARKALSFLMQPEAEAAVESDVFEMSENSVESKLFEEIQGLISTAGEAFNSEDLDTFLSFLDDDDSTFFRYQRARARLAFRQFDEISGTYSDVKVRVLNEEKLVVDLHCKLDAAHARSGRPVVLYDGAQSFTLRKDAGSDWKICAID